jgi:glutamate dehydrogenase
LSNIIVNEAGFGFVYRLQGETGASIPSIVRAYIIARSVLGMETIWAEIEKLENKIPAQDQTEIMMAYVRLLRRISRWFLRSQRQRLDIAGSVEFYAQGVKELKKAIPEIAVESFHSQYELHLNEFRELGIPDDLAHELTSARGLFTAMDIIEIASKLDIKVSAAAEAYFGVGEFLQLGWIRTQIIMHPTENHWESQSREALRDDLDWQQRQLTANIIGYIDKKHKFMPCLAKWSESHSALITRWQQVLTSLQASNSLNYTMFFVAIRELLDLTQTTMQASEISDVEEVA